MDNLANTTPVVVPTFRNPPEAINVNDPRYNPFAVLGQLDSPATVNPSKLADSHGLQTFTINPSVATTISLLPPSLSSTLSSYPPPISTSTVTTPQRVPSRSIMMCPPPPATRCTDSPNLSGAINTANPLLDVNFDGWNRWITQGPNTNRNISRPNRDESKGSQSRKRLSPLAYLPPRNKAIRSDQTRGSSNTISLLLRFNQVDSSVNDTNQDPRESYLQSVTVHLGDNEVPKTNSDVKITWSRCILTLQVPSCHFHSKTVEDIFQSNIKFD
eukprot:TRINITY_DN2657_c0_g4_i2.p1 TRINITY_DN2657_c0_g4~~TRINITY_DN2657_c0_g4_i2.p1  ORF type:complete len:272 (+),score=17.84 TRINITY_DN2657_c0_g4_i2:101-916(+)